MWSTRFRECGQSSRMDVAAYDGLLQGREERVFRGSAESNGTGQADVQREGGTKVAVEERPHVDVSLMEGLVS